MFSLSALLLTAIAPTIVPPAVSHQALGHGDQNHGGPGESRCLFCLTSNYREGDSTSQNVTLKTGV
jgi:hypothetical protein